MINVFLDDLRPCPPGFVAARTAEECLLLLAECEVGILSLDYDLGYGQPNGSEVVRGIIVSGKYPKEIYVHSSSKLGREYMARELRAAAPAGVSVHDGPMPADVLQAAAAAEDGRRA
ncbi:cell division protein FtsJ [Cohnella sp. CFH 77786]|uniref:cyclic-phosphate processing receiver domain-containing protein n=1 Tax=Cohnella sp. CFH 77786 TaxID=2662265 RepID=UPI001C60BADE|nr:cyclic-phosphate processing receiver domain-containing protein [Cohnella sp. CFH 77786]MBW5448173.1 cell division protein FtsJ [Cohnella sp. CFH 77786]